jgi:hypothetical protein
MAPRPSSTPTAAVRCSSTCDLSSLTHRPAPRSGSFSVSDIHFERSLQGLRAEGSSLERLHEVDTAIFKAEMSPWRHHALMRSAVQIHDFMDRRVRHPARREVTVIGPPATQPSVDPLPWKCPFLIPSSDEEAPF